MNPKMLIYAIAILFAFVFISCTLSELSWSMKENNSNSLRYAVGLPSVAVGNLSPSARNPGVEVLCTGLYDVPGGYCSYYSMGVPFISFPMPSNFTIISNSADGGK
jgi:hypothetical protein